MWTLDVCSGELAYQDEIIGRLNQSETLILSCLVTNNDLLVSKDVLLAAGWPNKFVAPNSLNAAIKNIRQLLSSRDSDIFIETAHRKGYILRGKYENFKIVQVIPVNNTVIDDLTSNDEGDNTSKSENANNSHISTQCIENSKVQRVIKKRLIKLVIIGYFLVTVIIAVLISVKPSELYCINIEDSTFCGLLKLKKEDEEYLRLNNSLEKGLYYYGYDGALDEIKVYRYN
ncbi:winged helix-turn-helix domain-containing protein [Shewanella xiamenensis]|uniref:winged helix-turn-helix domain-containing protein n=1 Tax=Shewanella xiamenensis TaxID=332186 RepID=UPI0035B88B91